MKKNTDKSVRISRKSFNFLKEVKKNTGLSFKRIIDNLINGDIKVK